MASISRRFFEFFVERLLFVSLSFSGCTAWFLMAQSRFFEQPPATRDRVFDIVGFGKILLDERRRPRRRIEPYFFRRSMDSCFELFLLCFRELSLSLRPMSISYGLLKRLISIESREPAIDRPSLHAIPLG
ncbi:hypothetical protein C480_21199 [Natrialba aegyptia DSM 13077]|uniref:Uncharacterized protein n=1 Tax=Natrialba aegyptia DSM 13077 TaxID=1227491 RepID=M0AJ73_9EURY|nr:hypothetical protein C480_21199 [Natrialba aegyptia DSM 13077]